MSCRSNLNWSPRVLFLCSGYAPAHDHGSSQSPQRPAGANELLPSWSPWASDGTERLAANDLCGLRRTFLSNRRCHARACSLMMVLSGGLCLCSLTIPLTDWQGEGLHLLRVTMCRWNWIFYSVQTECSMTLHLLRTPFNLLLPESASGTIDEDVESSSCQRTLFHSLKTATRFERSLEHLCIWFQPA